MLRTLTIYLNSVNSTLVRGTAVLLGDFNMIKEELERIRTRLEIYSENDTKEYPFASVDIAMLLKIVDEQAAQIEEARKVASYALSELKFLTKHRTCVFCGGDNDQFPHNDYCPFFIGKDW